MNQKLVVGVEELAVMLGLSPKTVRWYSSVKPELLPPKFNNGLRRLQWSVADVQRWVELKSNYRAYQPTRQPSDCNISEEISSPCDQ